MLKTYALCATCQLQPSSRSCTKSYENHQKYSKRCLSNSNFALSLLTLQRYRKLPNKTEFSLLSMIGFTCMSESRWIASSDALAVSNWESTSGMCWDFLSVARMLKRMQALTLFFVPTQIISQPLQGLVFSAICVWLHSAFALVICAGIWRQKSWERTWWYAESVNEINLVTCKRLKDWDKESKGMVAFNAWYHGEVQNTIWKTIRYKTVVLLQVRCANELRNAVEACLRSFGYWWLISVELVKYDRLAYKKYRISTNTGCKKVHTWGKEQNLPESFEIFKWFFKAMRAQNEANVYVPYTWLIPVTSFQKCS